MSARGRVALALCALVLSVHAPAARAQNTVFGAPYVLPVASVAPGSVAVDEARDRVLVLDTGGRHVRFATIADFASGAATWSTLSLGDDPADPDSLLEPQGLAVAADGALYVVDTFRARVVRFTLDPSGASYTRDVAFAPTVPAPALRRPRDIAVAPDGHVFLLDTANQRVLVLDDGADTSWSVFASEPAWGQAYGLGVDAAHVAVAATDASQVFLYPVAGGAATVLLRHGDDDRGVRTPRDVAFDPDGGLVVADTANHRIKITNASGDPRFELESPGLFNAPASVVCDSQGRIFAVDQGYDRVVAWLGPDAPKPFDLVIRDFVGDVGIEDAVDPIILLASPDILVRHASDVTTTAVPRDGLGLIAFQEPRFDESNYVYLQVANLGPLASTPGQVRLYWADTDSDLTFPDDFSTAGIYRSWYSPTQNIAGNWLYLPGLAPGGYTVLGPLVWRPPAPEAVQGDDGKVDLVARIVHLDDPSLAASGLDGVRHSNDVARRPVTVSRGPFPVGEQNLLVVRTRFPGMAPATAYDVVQDRVVLAGQWVSSASHATAWVDPLHLEDLVILDHDPSWYADPSRTPVIELAQEVLGKIPAGTLDGATPDPDDDIDRVIIITNSPLFAHQATTGPWPYTMGGATRYLTVSIQGSNDGGTVLAHGLGHQFGMRDLLAHENVHFSRPYADGWDNMAEPMNGALPLVWSQDLATWVTEAGGVIRFVRRPGNGQVVSDSVDLRYAATLGSGDTVAIAFGLTPGVTTFEQETRFYWVEARSPAVGGFESVVPGEGVLVYLATEEIPQGQGPVIVRDHGLTTPDSLGDAAVPDDETEAPGGTGLSVHVDDPLADGDGFRVTYSYDPPEIGVDPYIRAGDPNYWESTDIWVDNLSDGYDEDNGDTPHFSAADAIEGEENRVYALISNHGPATAYDVEVAFYFSSPWHTIDGHDAFEYIATTFVPQLAEGESKPVFVPWTPPEIDPNAPIDMTHHCVMVEIRRQVDDTHPDNNSAQRNLHVAESATHSPYPPVVATFQLAQKADAPQGKLVYPRLDGVPKGWSWSFDQPSVRLEPGDRKTVTLTVKPNEDTPKCRRYDMQVTGWQPSGDTLVQLGGTALAVLTKNGVDLTADTFTRPCDREKKEQASWARSPKQCAVVGVKGCTDPAQPNTEILVRYRDPAGNPVYHTVMTDAYGCYEDLFISGEGGAWTVDVDYAGDDCNGHAHVRIPVFVGIPSDGDHDDDGVIDSAECQNDPDRDGIPCVLDPDDGGGKPGGGTPGECRKPPNILVLAALVAIVFLLVMLVLLWRTCPRPPRHVLIGLLLALALAVTLYLLIVRGRPWCTSLDALLWFLRIALLLALLVILRCLRRRSLARARA